MQMRWPAQHVVPELMSTISLLAQRTTRATYADLKKANSVLEQMKLIAGNGQAKITYHRIPDDPMFITFFDASLGKSTMQSAQLGEIHFLTSEKAKVEPSKANIVEYHSNKISRVVKSSLAAEGCAMTAGADHQLFFRLLWDALYSGKLTVGSNWRADLISKGALVTDAKSLFDHCHKVGHMAAERQTALDILSVKLAIQDGLLELFWTPTFKQIADPLTKEMDFELITEWKRSGKICLVSTENDLQEEQKRANIRRGQRERRNARMEKANTSLPLC